MIDIKIISCADFLKIKKKKIFTIHFGFHPCPFGRCLIGLFGDRICHLSFVNTLDSVNLNVLESQWPGSHLLNDQKLTLCLTKKIFKSENEVFKVLLKGTSFEAKVWRALIKIPKGKTVSYKDVAEMTGYGSAVRAAANAVAKNFVAFVIPCHRVIKKNGIIHKYQWGGHIKRKILQFEKIFC